MPLLDHFNPPLHGPRRWEGFLHAWTTLIAKQLNLEALPPGYYSESAIKKSPPKPNPTVAISFAQLEACETNVYQDLGCVKLRGAIELISPANKDRAGNRRTFAAKCAGYLKNGIGLMIVDIVTARSANLHQQLFDVLDVKDRRAVWESPTKLYAVPYRPVTVRKRPRVEVWPVSLALGKVLPVLPLWLSLDLCVPVRLEESYLDTCGSLRISA